MALFLFSRTDQENPELRKQLRNIVYLGCGSFISLCLVLIVVLHYLPGTSWLQPHHPLFWLEVLALEAFGVAWFVKGGMFILKDKNEGVVTSKNETIPTVEQGVPATDTPQQERSATSEGITSSSIITRVCLFHVIHYYWKVKVGSSCSSSVTAPTGREAGSHVVLFISCDVSRRHDTY